MASKVRYKICHLLFEEFPSDPRIRRYVNALTESGIYSIIICSKTKNESFFEQYHGNLVYRIPISKHRQSFFLTFLEYIGFTFITSFLLIFLGIKYRFKIIHSNTLPDFLIIAAIFNKIFGAKLILDLHELFPEIFAARRPHLAGSFYIKILKFQENLSIKLADIVITIHEPAKQIFMNRNKHLEEKIYIVMNGVDENEFKITRREKTDKFIIIYNGAIVKLWSLPLIIHSLKILKSSMPPEDFNKIIFKIYGRGPDLDNILNTSKELSLSEKVSYEGVLSHGKMSDEILKADVCVLPCIKNIYTDLFYSIKLIEMLYLKIPVIATRLNTYKYYYSEDSLFYFDSGNETELAEKIKEVFYSPEIVKNKTENAYREYKNLSWNAMKERYLKIIGALLQ